MSTQWKILLYRTSRGNPPVKEFIDGLEPKAQSKTRNIINLLSDFGTSLSFPCTKKLTGTKLWELRILGSDNIRFFYLAMPGKTFLLLHGFKKKKNKTPEEEIKIAEKRLAHHLSQTYLLQL